MNEKTLRATENLFKYKVGHQYLQNFRSCCERAFIIYSVHKVSLSKCYKYKRDRSGCSVTTLNTYFSILFILCTHMRTLCLPMIKETLRLQGLTKLDQLVSMMMYSPFRAQKRMEWSKGWPAFCKTDVTEENAPSGEL